MLTLSPSAVEAVDHLLHRPEVPDDAGLRIRAATPSWMLARRATGSPSA
jgi:hypothetical protein